MRRTQRPLLLLVGALLFFACPGREDDDTSADDDTGDDDTGDDDTGDDDITGDDDTTAPPVEVTVSPDYVETSPTHVVTFEAQVTGTENQEVVWSTESPNEIDEDGTLVTREEGSFQVHATSVADPEARGSAWVVSDNTVGEVFSFESIEELLGNWWALGLKSDDDVMAVGTFYYGYSKDVLVGRYGNSGYLEDVASYDFGLRCGGRAVAMRDDWSFVLLDCDSEPQPVGTMLISPAGDFLYEMWNEKTEEDGMAHDIAADLDGGLIVATEHTLFRNDATIPANIAQDLSFGDSGAVRFTYPGDSEPCFIADVIVTEDGTLLALSAWESDDTILPLVFAIDTAGQPVAGWGTDGMAEGIPVEGYVYPQEMAIDGDGRVVIVGSVTSVDEWDTMAQRFLPDGTLDTSFGDGGVLRIDSLYKGYTVAYQPSGYLVFGDVNRRLARTDIEGQQDNWFSGEDWPSEGGHPFVDLGVDSNWLWDTLVHPDGKLFAAGADKNGDDVPFLAILGL